MKKLIYLLLLVVATISQSCSSKPAQTGQVTVKNGEDKDVTISYEIPKLNYDSFISQIDGEKFQTIVEKASSEAHINCKFLPTYEPRQISLIISGDTVTTFLTFFAKNGYGVKDSGVRISKFKGSNLIETF